MRKLFSTLKSVVAVAIVASMTLASSCSYDDTAIKNRVDKVEKDLASLTERVTALENKLKTDVEALTELINNKAVVSNLTTDDKGVVTVELSNGKSFKVYPECTVQDTDTDTYLGVKADEDGKLYWAIFEKGEFKAFLMDGENKVPVYDCVGDTDTNTDTNTTLAPKEDNGVLYWAVYEMGEFKEWLLVDGEKVALYDGNDQDDNVCDNPIEDTNTDTYLQPVAEDGVLYWAIFDINGEQVGWVEIDGEKVALYDGNDCDYVPTTLDFQVNAETGMLEFSIDGGQTWKETGLTAAEAGEQLITGVVDNDNNTVTFFLGETAYTFLKAELVEFNTTRGHLYVKPGQTKDVNFTINTAVADVNVMNQPLGWKAEVAFAAAEEEGDDENVEAMPLAVGGTEFVLKITAPSQAFVNAGFAETSGNITVHFNGNNGSCQVGKIAVELASITLDVDKAGNVTVTSTWVDEYIHSSWYGEEFIQEFNNYYVTIMPIEYYVEDLSTIYDAEKDEFSVPDAGSRIYNFFNRVNEEYNTNDKTIYADGVNEQWIFKATVEEIIDELDWAGNLTYEGNSFMVLVIPTDPQNFGALVFDQALAAPFKQLNVNVEVAETAWNNVYLNATLRGANAYWFNIQNKAEIDWQIENEWYESWEAYYEDYIYYWQNYNMQFGEYRITTDVVADNISLNDLVNYGAEYPYAYELAPNTTYMVAILAEEDGKTDYSYADLKIIEFTTADIVAAATPFEYTVVRNDEACTYFEVSANVTVPETTVAVYSAWVDEESMEMGEENKNNLIQNGWCKNDFTEGYTYELSKSTSVAGEEKYLELLIIDAEGNYSFGQATLKSNEVVVNESVNLTIENVEFLTEGGVANITLGGLEGVEFTAIKAYVCATDVSSYYLRTEEQLQDLAYKSNYWLYREYDANPFTVTKTSDSKDAAVEGKTYIVAVAAQLADGSVTKVVYEEIEFAAAEAGPIVFTSAAAENAYSQYYGDYKKLTLSNDTMTVVFGLRNGGYSYLPQTTYGNYWDDQSATYSVMDTYTCWTWDNVFTANNAVPTVVVSLNEEGKYKLDITVAHYDGSVPAVEAVFEGDINGIGYETDGGETIETIELTSAVATSAGSNNIGGTGYNLTFSDGNGTEIVYMVQTLGNTYLKEGEWNGDYSWNEEGYISSVTWTNVDTAWPYAMTVAVVDGAYDINLEIVDYYGAGQPTRTAHYAGQIEGFTLPGAGGENEEIVTENLTFELSTIDGYTSTAAAAYCDIRLVDTNGKNYVQIEANDPSLYTHSYTIDNITHYNNGTLYYSNTYVVYSGNPTEENVKMNSGTIDVTVDGDNCTIVIDAVLADGKAFSGTYTGAKPF